MMKAQPTAVLYIFMNEQAETPGCRNRKFSRTIRLQIVFFGGSVAIDGDYAVVGAYSDDNGGSTINNYGAAYVFKRSYAGIWEQQQKLRAESPGFGDYYGTSVAIFGDYIIVGAEEADVTRDLAVYPRCRRSICIS